MRLDSIIAAKGLAERHQIQEALDYQRKYGDRLETHLYRLGIVDEIGLVGALSEQFGCEGVPLDGLDIPPAVAEMIPPSLARNHLALPFAYDPGLKTIDIACENPSDSFLTSALATALPETTIRRFVALGVTLKCAILDSYRNHLVDIPADDSRTDSEHIHEPSSSTHVGSHIETAKDVFRNHGKTSRVLILNQAGTNLSPLTGKLEENEYDSRVADSLDVFLQQYAQTPPGIVLLAGLDSAAATSELVYRLADSGVFVDQTPTFLLPTQGDVEELSATLEDGIEDVVSLDGNLTQLIIKMNRVRDRIENESSRRFSVIQDMGTYGNLEDINLLDLLQTVGPARKTARISITGQGSHLTLYINKGDIVYAECNGKLGPEAVYEGIAWTRGIWNIDPIQIEELPEANNHFPNETIMLEGCRLLDESKRTECLA